jgi:hypothetical protein
MSQQVDEITTGLGDNMQESAPAALQPIMQPILHPIIQADKGLFYSCAMTYGEYVAAAQRPEFLEMRAREIRLLPQEQLYFTDYPDPIHWLVVVGDDTPDTLVVLPVLAHIAAWGPRLSLRLVREEEAAHLLSVLVNDADLLASWAEADLPLLLSFDDEWHFQEQWGPHPQAFDPYIERWLAEHREIEQLADDESPAGQIAYARLIERLTQEMRLWYNSMLNQACGEELAALLARWHEENGDEA